MQARSVRLKSQVHAKFVDDQQRRDVANAALDGRQADKIGLKNSMRLVAPILLYTTRVLAGSSAFDGVVGGTSYYWRLEDTIPTANVFNRRFRAMTEGRVPTSYGALGFAGVLTVLTAAKNAGSIETAMRKRPTRPLLFLDLALPRDVEAGAAAGAGNVFLYNLDDLAKIAEENRSARAAEAERSRSWLEERAARLWQDLAARATAPRQNSPDAALPARAAAPQSNHPS